MTEIKGPGQYEFHYRREERLSAAPDSVKNLHAGKSFWKKNIPLVLLFINLAIIAVVYVAVTFFFYPDSSKKELDGYTATVNAFLYEGRILAAFRILNTGSGTLPGPGDGIQTFEVSISVIRDTDAGEPLVQEYAGELPSEHGGEAVVHARFPHRSSGESISVQVRMNGEEFELSTPVKF